MKKIILLFLLFYASTLVFACRCVNESFGNEWLKADVVALVTIDRTYDNFEFDDGTGRRNYKADITFEKTYKGNKFKMLKVFGTTTYASSRACEKLVEKGEKYLILLYKNGNQEYLVSSCSPMYQISRDEILNKYENIFKLFKKHEAKIVFQKFALYDDMSEHYDQEQNRNINDFSNLNTDKLKDKVGIYKVKIDNDGKIKVISPIEKIGFREKKIQQLIKKNFTVYIPSNSILSEFLILIILDF